MTQDISPKRITKLLLGQVSERERERLEIMMLIDDESFETLLAVEEELIDDYVNDRLPRKDRQAFEGRLLGPARADGRIDFARSLAAVGGVAPAHDSQAPAMPPASPLRRLPRGRSPGLLLAASLLLVLGAGWLAYLVLPGGGVSHTADLFPGAVRGSQDRVQVAVPSQAAQIKLRLDLDVDQPYDSFRAVLETVEGREIHRQDGLAATAVALGSVVEFTVRAADLPPGDYRVILWGKGSGAQAELAAIYDFEVVASNEPRV